MDNLIQQSISLVEHAHKTEVTWHEAYDKPWSQPYHSYDAEKGEWTATSNTAQKRRCTRPSVFNGLAVFSWNIDFMLPFASSRMTAAIQHLKSLIAADPSPTSTANVICLAECVTSDLKVLAADPWIQEYFSLTDLDSSSWQSGYYGTTILVDKRLNIKDCFRVHYSKTRMDRDALFVDLDFASCTNEESGKVMRLCNTHLESLALKPAYRPHQLALCAQHMKASSVTAAVLAGDLNAIQDFDRTLHSENGLKDAYLELGGEEDDAEGGHTWGQQTSTRLRDQFGTSRMDKILFCGEGVALKVFVRFGAGIKVSDEEERQMMVALGFEQPWITDHLGVKAVFDISALVVRSS